MHDHRTLQTGADNVGKVSIKVENEAGGKQKQEQGVRGGPDKDKYVVGGRGEKNKDVTKAF